MKKKQLTKTLKALSTKLEIIKAKEIKGGKGTTNSSNRNGHRPPIKNDI